MKRALIAAALIAACSLASATSLGSFGSTTNSSDVTQGFMFSGGGSDAGSQQTYTLDLAAGKYDLDFAALVKTSVLGTIESVSFDGTSFADNAGAFTLINDTFTLAKDEVLSFVVDTKASPSFQARPGMKTIMIPGTEPSYIGVFALTGVGMPQALAVDETSGLWLTLAGLGLLAVMMKRKGTHPSTMA